MASERQRKIGGFTFDLALSGPKLGTQTLHNSTELDALDGLARAGEGLKNLHNCTGYYST